MFGMLFSLVMSLSRRVAFMSQFPYYYSCYTNDKPFDHEVCLSNAPFQYLNHEHLFSAELWSTYARNPLSSLSRVHGRIFVLLYCKKIIYLKRISRLPSSGQICLLKF